MVTTLTSGLIWPFWPWHQRSKHNVNKIIWCILTIFFQNRLSFSDPTTSFGDTKGPFDPPPPPPIRTCNSPDPAPGRELIWHGCEWERIYSWIKVCTYYLRKSHLFSGWLWVCSVLPWRVCLPMAGLAVWTGVGGWRTPACCLLSWRRYARAGRDPMVHMGSAHKTHTYCPVAAVERSAVPPPSPPIRRLTSRAFGSFVRRGYELKKGPPRYSNEILKIFW